ncbi:hypothetical protein SIAM614_20770 [Stappia aggregata IAM 12614]|uniref:Uncharacterized protein n=1 Tax=Roseibium aggregatum (strain ATCC 25650 / DSM 13394 / JCM 20685 / NBRC 16684 / NCIMB 2208 / IAM 12614 / B1) TaxID=384765 RepID=A0NYG5_ROSAI|nr:hypothetical protein SIAM614_20770 [Stappia aggregata IAM 12614] [Roseibium aggregatum IAM 12614]
MTASANCIAAPYRRVNVGISRAAAAISQSASAPNLVVQTCNSIT